MKRFVLLFLLFFPATIAAQVNRVSNRNSSLTVYAGSDKTITLPDTATLSGSVIVRPGTLKNSINWIGVGPGAVMFADPHAAATTASFSIAGSYVLTLSANTSRLQTSSKLVVTVNPAAVIPPSNLSVSLGWDAVIATDTAPVNGYNVWRLQDGGAWVKAGTTTATTFTDILPIAATYTYSVKAFNDVGESETSNMLKVIR